MLDPLPSRNVARFMLPLADVMTVLFSLFLLLPHLERKPEATAASTKSSANADQQQRLRDELERLRRVSQVPAHRRLYLVSLAIDVPTGQLVRQEGGQEKRYGSQEDIDAMVQEDQGAAKAADRELFYVLHYPSLRETGAATIKQLLNYRSWFNKWRVPFEITGSGLP